jgi:predicted amidohydrolase YtcJ
MLSWNLEPLDYLSSILGDRAASLLPLRRMQDLGIVMSGGSDAPCTLPDPIAGLFGACNHFVPEQSLTIAEALRLFTYNVAWGSFDEDRYGSLERGKMANMVILNRNPLEMEPSDLCHLAVEESLFAGQPYRSGMGIAGMVWHGLMGRTRRI